jgi:hypothetical protein
MVRSGRMAFIPDQEARRKSMAVALGHLGGSWTRVPVADQAESLDEAVSSPEHVSCNAVEGP